MKRENGIDDAKVYLGDRLLAMVSFSQVEEIYKQTQGLAQAVFIAARDGGQRLDNETLVLSLKLRPPGPRGEAMAELDIVKIG